MSDAPPQPQEFVAPSLEELNQLIPGYEFESFIAKGGMGAVYLARQSSLDRLVAIKVLPPVLCESDEFKESFETEAKLMAKLNHPNLIGIYDFGNINGMLYIVMEYVKGKSLFHSAGGKMIEQETAVNIISGVCEGLEHAHEVGMLHRDVKPANILLNKKAVPKIGDFGLARPSEMTETGIIFGTPDYLAPEVLAAPERVDGRTDLFSVGVIFYELLTGHLPSAPYVSVTEHAECDIRFDNVIRRAIHPEIDRRYKTVSDLSDALKEVINTPQATSRLLTGNSSGVRQSNIATSPVGIAKRPLIVGAAGTNAPKLNASTATAHLDTKIKVSGTQAGAINRTTGLMPSLATTGSIHQDSLSSGKTRMVWSFAAIFVLLGAIYFLLEAKSAKEAKIAEERERYEAAELAKEEAELQARKEARLKLEARVAREKAEREAAAKAAAVVLSPLEQLEKVKSQLMNGERPMPDMPDTIFKRSKDSRILMFVEKAMTWDEASLWAREHGGYISVCSSLADMPVFSKKMPEGTNAVWLGAGNVLDKSWGWLDGTVWPESISLPPATKREFVTLSNKGVLGVDTSDKKHPFFIEWRTDGSNPAALKTCLTRTRDSLAGELPMYPPGTMHYGERCYCLIKHPLTRAQAMEMASSAGGYLVAISDNDEKKFLTNFLNKNAVAGETYWTAATKKNQVWSWQNGENWIKQDWSEKGADSTSYAVIEAAESMKLKEVADDYSSNGFIIEWSKDASTAARVRDSLYSYSEFAELRGKAQELIEKEQKVEDVKRASHAQKLQLKLKAHKRSLADAGQDNTYALDRMIERLSTKKHIPKDLATKVNGSEEVAEIVNEALKEQNSFEFERTEAIEKLRESYARRLTKMSKEMQNSKKMDMSTALDSEILRIGDSATSFQEYVK